MHGLPPCMRTGRGQGAAALMQRDERTRRVSIVRHIWTNPCYLVLATVLSYHHQGVRPEAMARLVRAGLDTLGKALRETGQALDRVGLEALGSTAHKELCKYTMHKLSCRLNY